MPATSGRSASAAVHRRLSHPVLDADAHWLEPLPVLIDYVADVIGRAEAHRFHIELVEYLRRNLDPWYELSPEQRMRTRRMRPDFWVEPADAYDKATCMMPGLMYERLDDFGIDVAIVYPSISGVALWHPSPEVRSVLTRAYNTMVSDLFGPWADRLLPVASISVGTPEEGIEEVTHAVETLGLRAIMIYGMGRRLQESSPDGATFYTVGSGTYVDVLALDSAFDYDPFWQRCVDLGVAVSTHAPATGLPNFSSPTNYVFNHIGHFATACEAFCKAVVLGGVARRFPSLNFAFLEGGVTWGMRLLDDLKEHFETRNVAALRANLEPTLLDVDEFERLIRTYGSTRMVDHVEELLRHPVTTRPWLDATTLAEREIDVDDFAASGITSKSDVDRLFDRFYFGCEADDKSAAHAFDPRTHRMNAMFSSDIGHFDVPDLTMVLAESYELVERGHLGEADFAAYAFGNAVRLHGSTNPDFLAGTVVADAAEQLLGTGSPTR